MLGFFLNLLHPSLIYVYFNSIDLSQSTFFMLKSFDPSPTGLQVSDAVEFAEECISIDELRPLPYVSQEAKEEDSDDLYESIKEQGLKLPFVVARQPNSKDYVLIAGGNSRLEIVRRLRDESRGSQYNEVSCVVLPWPGTATAKLNHLITNDVVHTASFIERAKAILNFIDSNPDLPIDRSTSDREVSKFFKENGFPLYRTTYRAMKYAVGHLDNFLPLSLAASLSTQDVKNIQQLEENLKRLWTDAGKSESEFDQLFASIASSCDNEALDYETFHNVLTEEISKELHYIEEQCEAESSREICDNAPLITNSALQKSNFEANAAYTVNQEESSNSNDISFSSDEQEPSEQIRQLAMEIAHQFDLQDCLTLSEQGEFGFLVVELPPEEVSQTARQIWEYLANFSGTWEKSKSELNAIVSTGSRLYQEIQEHEISPSLETAKELDLSVMWTLDSKNFERLLKLWKLVFEHTSVRPNIEATVDAIELDEEDRMAA